MTFALIMSAIICGVVGYNLGYYSVRFLSFLIELHRGDCSKKQNKEVKQDKHKSLSDLDKTSL